MNEELSSRLPPPDLPPSPNKYGEASPRGTQFGPFVLDSRLAVGGTAEVYLAHPTDPASDLPTTLVVKRLLPSFQADPEGRQMFDREAKLHAQVHHPNVVEVFGSGASENGEPYLAMEYVPGVDGYRLVRKLRLENRPVPSGVATYVAIEVLHALEAVHAARGPSGTPLGIVHRDVSPSNVYFARNGGVKLGDFGIARSLARRTLTTDPNQGVKGKFAYLAPEQVAGEPADHRADLFSLGNVLAEMLLGQPLFPGNGQLAVLLAIRDCHLDALDSLSVMLDPGLVEVLRTSLSRDPAKRFPNAAAFREALVPFQIEPAAAKSELMVLVKATEAASSTASLNAVRASVSAMRAVRPSGSSGNVSSSTLAAVRAHMLEEASESTRFAPPSQEVLNSAAQVDEPPTAKVSTTPPPQAPTRVPPSKEGNKPASKPALLDLEESTMFFDAATRVSTVPPQELPATDFRKTSDGVGEGDDEEEDESDTTNRFAIENLGLIDESRRTSAPPPPDRPHRVAGSSAPPRSIDAGRRTKEIELLPSFVHTNGRKLGPYSFSKLVEEISSGVVERGMLVDYMARGPAPVESIAELARLLPPLTPQKTRQGEPEPAEPGLTASLSDTSIYEILLRIFLQSDNGLLMVEGGDRVRKELYISDRKLQHVSSSDTSELLGEMLVQWGKLQRHELDMALAVMPKFDGRLGDTLIGLGLVEAMDVFHAIREQGRDRVGDMFVWKSGTLRFYPDAPKPDFEFALELPLPDIILRGLELSLTGELLMKKHKKHWNSIITAVEDIDADMYDTNVWPPAFPHVLAFVNGSNTLAQVVEMGQVPRELDGADVLRVIDVLLAVNAVWWA